MVGKSTWQRRNGQKGPCPDTDQQHCRRQQRGADGPTDESSRDVHQLPVRCTTAGATVPCSASAILEPGFNLYCPATTTRVPGAMPSVMIAFPSCVCATL